VSESLPNDAAELVLAARLRTLREAGVSFARFDDSGRLLVVRFGVVDGGLLPATEEEERKPNPLRDAALRLARPAVSDA
jgi:hypothetical protein